MTAINTANNDRELNAGELDAVSGGTSKAPAPSKPAPPAKGGGVFEVEDYSFDIEQVIN